ncbi:cobyrinate a,c-diamide synthase [Alicyclobacillus suci]|uniref:cobyrinate a,c-diamide synthase n=1 Tax=Alicyclobacillus suci TaxID=2816080 RepID=UPI001A8FF2B6|nr:cobyrinate a,c-diamide synthase [Alicyclobacillus suci]
MKRPRLVIAGTNSGAGKTTIALGLMAALARRGLCVQGFKVGPDYIDSAYHTALTHRPSRNLDMWMMPKDSVREIFHRGSEGADISVIEGVMGLYDGKQPLSDEGSTAEVSRLLQAPVILVVNAASMARSAAAVVLGFQQLDPQVPLAGVIVNRVGSKGHYALVKAAIEAVCQVPVLGYLERHDHLVIPERHLGLLPAIERGELNDLFDGLADAMEATVDLDLLVELAADAADWQAPPATLFVGAPVPPFVKIAVARDSAFNFYYPENLELLAWYGAALQYFSPLAGELLPEDADGLYIGGGFPEEFAERLAEQSALQAQIRARIANGLPTFAECGGFMWLTESLRDKSGATHQMVGAIPARVQMQATRAALGYREVTALMDTLLLGKGETARGHEFHYSTVAQTCSKDEAGIWPHAYAAKGLRGEKPEGFACGNLLAGYTHLHFASNPQMIRRWLEVCRTYHT